MRPKNPYRWGMLETVYPGGINPWNGGSIFSPPASDYYTPKTKLAAQETNYVLNQITTSQQALLDSAGQDDSLNWPHGIVAWSTPLGTDTITGAPVWSAATGLWHLPTATTAPAGKGYSSMDGFAWMHDSTFDIGGTSGANVNGIITRASDGAALVIGFSSSISTFFNVCSIANEITGTVLSTTTYGLPGAGTGMSAGNWFSGAYFASNWVCWQGGSTLHPWYFATDAGAPVAAATWAPPASFVINNLAHIVSPNACLLFPSGTSVVGQYMRTTDGQNWAQQAMPSLIDAGASVVGSSYDKASGNYYMLSSNSTQCRVWQSATGLASSWTNVSTIPHRGYDLKCNGTEILVWIKFVTAGLTTYRGVVSTDGGVTWYFTSLLDTVAPGNYFSLRSNGSQFLYSNTSSFSSSAVVGGALAQVLL